MGNPNLSATKQSLPLSLFPNATPEAQSLIAKFSPAMGTMAKREWNGKISAILRDPLNQKISFSIGSLHISFALLSAIAGSFEQGSIPIIFDPYNVLLKMPGTAEYVHDLRIVVTISQYVDDKFEKSVLLHEAVHAIFHQRGLKRVVETETEVAAFLAQAMYCLLHNWSQSEVFTRWNSASGISERLYYQEPLSAAWDLAEFLLGKRQPSGTWSGAKSPGDDPAAYHRLISSLRSSVKSSPAYAKELNKVIDYSGF